MKSGAAASIYAAAIARDQGLAAGKTIWVSCTCLGGIATARISVISSPRPGSSPIST